MIGTSCDKDTVIWLCIVHFTVIFSFNAEVVVWVNNTPKYISYSNIVIGVYLKYRVSSSKTSSLPKQINSNRVLSSASADLKIWLKHKA